MRNDGASGPALRHRGGVGIYTHLTMSFVVIGQARACEFLLARRDPRDGPLRAVRSPLLAFALAGVLSLALYAPILGQVVLLPAQGLAVS